MRPDTLAIILLLVVPSAGALRSQQAGVVEGALATLDQHFQSAARHAAERCLADPSCPSEDLLAAPLGSLDPDRARRLRELAALAEAALHAHARELSRLHGTRAAVAVPAKLDRWRLDRLGTGELRLGGVADYLEVAIHLRGRIAAPDGVHPAAVVHFAERVEGRRPRVSRLLLPIAGVRLVAAEGVVAGSALPAPRLGWQGAILEELGAGGWSRVLEPSSPAGSRRRLETGFCDAACSESDATGGARGARLPPW
jgi:hypothetical protein